MGKKMLLMINPISGQKRANRFLPEIIRLFNDRGYTCEVYVTACSGDATRYAALKASEYGRIVCIGGDGTLNETIAGVIESGYDCPIGYIPAGTTNDFAASLGLSSDIMQAATDAADGIAVPFDTGELNGRNFVYTASCGAFARTSYTTPQNLKNTFGHLAYIMEGVKDLPSLKPVQMKITAQDKVLEGKFLFVSVTNSLSVGGVLKLDSSKVNLNDGLFEVMLVRDYDTPAQLGRIISSLLVCDIPNEHIEFFKASSLTIEAEEEIEWTVDGERGEGGKNFDIENKNRRIRLILPEKAMETIPAEVSGEDQLQD